jgi:AcrR family transcriptional regulator
MEPGFAAVTSVRRKGGRPLSFDRDAALEQAMLLFWQHGYETTSIADLTHAMGISAPSLYTAFGDKQRLFLEAAHRYAGDLEAIGAVIDEAPTALDAARMLLTNAVIVFTGATTPPGCLLTSTTASGSAASADVRTVIAGYRREVRERLQARIDRDVAQGVLPNKTDSITLSGLVMTMVQGLSVMAREGASRAHLSDIANAALHAWPGA